MKRKKDLRRAQDYLTGMLASHHVDEEAKKKPRSQHAKFNSAKPKGEIFGLRHRPCETAAGGVNEFDSMLTLNIKKGNNIALLL